MRLRRPSAARRLIAVLLMPTSNNWRAATTPCWRPARAAIRRSITDTAAPTKGVRNVWSAYDHKRPSPPERGVDRVPRDAQNMPKRRHSASASPTQPVLSRGRGSPLLQEAFVVPHHQLGLKLLHGVQRHPDH